MFDFRQKTRDYSVFTLDSAQVFAALVHNTLINTEERNHD